MYDRLLFSLLGLAALAMIGLALVWPQGLGARSPGPFGHEPVQQAKARYEEVLANYRKSLLTAFQDVEDALSNLHLQAEQEDAQSRAVDAAREYYNLSLLQQQQGLLTMLQLIDADRTLLSSELALAQVKSSRLVSTVLLIKALGGGWNPRQPTTRPATQPAALTFLPPAGLPTTAP